MQELNGILILLLGLDILETSIYTSLFYKAALSKKFIEKSFYLKVLIFSTLITGSYSLYLFLFTSSLNIFFNGILSLFYPLILFLFTVYYNKLVIIQRNGYEDYVWKKSVWVSFFTLLIIFFQVNIFFTGGNLSIMIILQQVLSLA